MEKKKTNISASGINEISSFIKDLGGAKSIYSYLKSKNINVNIELIYKWKNNGIPHRYLLYIKELADYKNIKIPKNIFPNNIDSADNKVERTSAQENNSKNININIKVYRLAILIIIVASIFLIFQFLYHHRNNKVINQKLLKLENITKSLNIHDYDKKLDSLNMLIKDKYLLDIKNIYSLSTINENKIKNLEKNITIFLNNNKIQNSDLNSFNTTLINLIVLKESIKFVKKSYEKNINWNSSTFIYRMYTTRNEKRILG